MFGLNKIFLFLIGFVLILNLSFGASSYSDFRDKTFCDFLAEPSDNEKTNLASGKTFELPPGAPPKVAGEGRPRCYFTSRFTFNKNPASTEYGLGQSMYRFWEEFNGLPNAGDISAVDVVFVDTDVTFTGTVAAAPPSPGPLNGIWPSDWWVQSRGFRRPSQFNLIVDDSILRCGDYRICEIYADNIYAEGPNKVASPWNDFGVNFSRFYNISATDIYLTNAAIWNQAEVAANDPDPSVPSFEAGPYIRRVRAERDLVLDKSAIHFASSTGANVEVGRELRISGLTTNPSFKDQSEGGPLGGKAALFNVVKISSTAGSESPGELFLKIDNPDADSGKAAILFKNGAQPVGSNQLVSDTEPTIYAKTVTMNNAKLRDLDSVYITGETNLNNTYWENVNAWKPEHISTPNMALQFKGNLTMNNSTIEFNDASSDYANKRNAVPYNVIGWARTNEGVPIISEGKIKITAWNSKAAKNSAIYGSGTIRGNGIELKGVPGSDGFPVRGRSPCIFNPGTNNYILYCEVVDGVAYLKPIYPGSMTDKFILYGIRGEVANTSPNEDLVIDTAHLAHLHRLYSERDIKINKSWVREVASYASNVIGDKYYMGTRHSEASSNPQDTVKDYALFGIVNGLGGYGSLDWWAGRNIDILSSSIGFSGNAGYKFPM